MSEGLKDTELERIVLGEMLLDPEALDYGLECLSVTDFTEDLHQKIFIAIRKVFHNNTDPDLVTLVREMNASDSEKVYVAQLVDAVVSPALAQMHIDMLQEITLKRLLYQKLKQHTLNIIRSHQATGSELLDMIEADILSLGKERIQKTYQLGDLLPDIAQSIRHIAEGSKKAQGIPTYYYSFDTILAGLHPGKLIIIAGRPKAGKTSLAVNIIYNMVKNNIPVAFFSLEMSKEEIVFKLLSREIGVSTQILRTRPDMQTVKDVEEAVAKLIDGPLVIDDQWGLPVETLRARARRLKKQYGIKVIFIDYLQLMTSIEKSNSDRRELITHIVLALKNLARELEVPIVAIAQLNRAVERRTVNKPTLADLKESGSIEENSDVVIFLWYEKDQVNEKNPTIKITIAKHRDGPEGEFEMKFIKNKMLFSEIDTMYGEPTDDYEAYKDLL